MRTCIVALWLLMGSTVFADQWPTAPSQWEKEPSDFRGVKFGASMADAKEILKGSELICLKDSCRSILRLGDKVNVTTYLRFDADRFLWVGWSFSSNDWEFVRDVLIERYGIPLERTQEPVKTRAGVELMNETLRWYGNRIFVSSNRYGSSVTESFVQIGTKEWYERQLKQDEDAKKKAVGTF